MSMRCATGRGLFALVVMLLMAGFSLRAENVTVFAAASLTDALKDLAGKYEQQSGDTLVFNFGASSTLARQIEEGAPADVFFSADDAKMDGLDQKHRIVKETRKSLLGNQLVIVTAAREGAAIRTPQDLAQPAVTRLALGDPKAVPIGVYAKTYLTGLGIWSNVEAKVVATENVRAALAAVEAGNADASIVYKTDAAISKNVMIVFEVPLADGPAIRYPAAVVQESAHQDAAKRFLDYLATDDAGSVFRQFGFIVPAPPTT